MSRPTEEELNEAQSKKRLLKVPKGTSDYQASWIFDAEEVDQDDEGDDDDDDYDDEDDDGVCCIRFTFMCLCERILIN